MTGTLRWRLEGGSEADTGAFRAQHLEIGGRDDQAVAAALVGEPRLGFAGHQDLVITGGARRGLGARHQFVHARGIGALGREQVRLQRHEEMTDVLRGLEILVLVADLAAECRARHDAGEGFHHQRQARALRPAHRQHDAAIAGLRVGGRLSLRIERPAQRNRFAAIGRAPDLAARRHRRRHVQQQRCGAGGGHGERAGAEEGGASAPDRHRRRGVGHHHGRHALAQCLLKIAGRHAEVIAVGCEHDADAELPRPRDRLVHGARRHQETHAVAAVEPRHHGRGLCQHHLGTRRHQLLAQPPCVDRHPGYAVRGDIAQIGLDQALGDAIRIGLRQPVRGEDRGNSQFEADRRDGLGWIGHVSSCEAHCQRACFLCIVVYNYMQLNSLTHSRQGADRETDPEERPCRRRPTPNRATHR